MKILFLLPHLGLYGGVKCTLQLAKYLTLNGHEVKIIHPTIPYFLKSELKYPMQVLKFFYGLYTNYKRNHRFNWFSPNFEIIQVKSLKESYIPNADIIVATWWKHAEFISKLASTKGKKFHLIRSYEVWAGPAKIVNEIYRLPIPKIVIAKWMKKFFLEKFNNISINGIIPDSIDFTEFHKLESKKLRKNINKLKNSKNFIRIGCIYNHLKIKGLIDLFKALKIVQRKNIEFELVLFGHKPSKNHLNIIKSFQNYELHGILKGKDLLELYNSLDIYVMPSHVEGLPAPPMEAMACGVATVLTDVGAIREIAIDYKTSLIVPPKSPNDMANAILLLIQEPEFRKKLSENGYNHIRKTNSWKSNANLLEEIFKRA